MSSSAIACRTASHVPRQYFGTRVQLLLDKGKLSEGEGDDLCAAGEDEVRAVWGTSVEKCLLSQSLLKHYPQAADPQMCTSSQTQVSHSAAGNRSGVQPPTVLNLLSLANAGQWFISDVHEELSNLTQAGPSTMPTSYYSPQAATLTALPAANLQLPVAQWPFWNHNSPYTQSETPSHAYSSDSDYSSLGLSTTPTIGIASIAEPDDVMAFAEDPERLSAQFAPAGSAVKSAPAQLSASGYLSLQTLEAFAGSLDLSLLEDSATLGYQSHLPGAPGSLIDDLAPLFTSLDWRYDDQAAPLLELPALSSTSCMGFPSLSTPSAPFSHALGAGPLDLPPTLGVGKRKCDESESQANIDRRLQATSPEPFKKLLNKVKKAELAKAKADTALILGSEPSAKKVRRQGRSCALTPPEIKLIRSCAPEMRNVAKSTFRAAIRRGKGYTLLEGLRACKCCRESGVMCIAYESNVIPSFLTKETLYRHCQTCHHRKCKCVFERYSVTSMSQR